MVAVYALLLLFILLVIAAGVFFWRLSTGPVDLDFAKSHIERALGNPDQGYAVKLGRAVFEWPEQGAGLVLDVDDIRLVQGDAVTLSVAALDLELSYAHLLLGQIRPVRLILENPSLSLIRKEDGIRFQLQDQEIVRNEKTETTDVRQDIIDFVHMLDGNKYRRSGPFEQLRSVEVRDARVAVRDYVHGMSWYITDMDLSFADTREGLQAAFSVTSPGDGPGADNAGLSAALSYRKAQDDFTVTAAMKRFNPAALSKIFPSDLEISNYNLIVNGSVAAAFDKNLALENASVQFDSPQGVLDLPDLFEAPVDVRDAQIDLSYQSGDKTAQLGSFKATLNDVVFYGDGSAQLGEDSASIPLTIRTDLLPLESVPPLFPKTEYDSDAAEWLLRRLSEGSFSDVSVKTVLKADKREDGWSVQTSNTLLDFAFDGVSVKYSDSLMPATDTRGRGVFDFAAERLEITGEHTKIGDVVARKADMVFNDILVVGGGVADLKITAEGPLKTVFEYISDEPIDMGGQLGFDVGGVQGRADMELDISFPTVKDIPKEDVKVAVKAKLHDVTIPKVVEGLDLTGGPFDLTVKDGAFGVKGTGKLAGRDITLDWDQFLESKGKPYAMKAKAQIVADKELRHHFGIDLDEYISGDLPIDLVYTEKADDSAVIDVKGMLGPMRLHIDPFRYDKPPGVAGDVSLQAFLQDGVLKEVGSLNLKTRDFSLSGGRLLFRPMNGKDADLHRGKILRAVIGRTDMAVDFEIAADGILKVSAEGPALDIEPFSRTDRAGEAETPGASDESRPMMISATAKKMFIKDERFLNQTKTYIETNTGGDATRLEMDAKAGAGDVYIRFKPDAAGKRNFRMEAEDAGAFLYAMSLYDNIRGGTVRIYGEPKGRDLYGDLSGVAQIEKFRVVKAPGLAKLLSVMSLSGVAQLLNNEGLAFDRLESEIEWLFRDEGNLLVLKDGRTSGSSVGLTFEGRFDQAAGTMDMKGTIIPMTEVNNLLSNIPLVGELLTGGSGLIAATYTMKGPSDAPEVAINPLSVLTPGFLRKILFEGGGEDASPIRSEEADER